MAAAGFLSCYLNGPLPYICLTPYNVLSASLNKTFPSLFYQVGQLFLLSYVSVNDGKVFRLDLGLKRPPS